MASASGQLSRETSRNSSRRTDPPSQTCKAQCAMKNLKDVFRIGRRSSQTKTDVTNRVRSLSPRRMLRSLADKPFKTSDILNEIVHNNGGEEPTVLYLAYGSNLSSETFRGARGIKPISQINVVAPDLALDFSLSGIPYREPCFAGTHYRNPPSKEANASTPLLSLESKHVWNKPLIGVVYEVTPSDYANIIATEGGGMSYIDVVVSCYPLRKSAPTAIPVSASFKAHTLLGHPDSRHPTRKPNYAQPSARYLKLISDGAAEHDLPRDYQDFLLGLKPYTVTTLRQHIGAALFLAFWGPVIITLFGLGGIFADDKGRNPVWFIRILTAVFDGVWISYYTIFKPTFGEGERTLEEDEGVDNRNEDGMRKMSSSRGERYGSEMEKGGSIV